LCQRAAHRSVYDWPVRLNATIAFFYAMLPQRLLVGIAAYRQGNWTFDRLNNVGDANSRSGTGKHDSTACTARRTQQAGLRKNADKLLCGGQG
jgi:hypothetical protein